jgi:hypothetical protein
MYHIKNGIYNFGGQWIEDHVDSRRPYEVERFFQMLNFPRTIEIAKSRIEGEKDKMVYLQKGINQIAYIQSLRNEKAKKEKELHSIQNNISTLLTLVEKVENLESLPSLDEKMKVLNELKIIRLL